jgi:alpha-beta hydrolase superfamily lysophospholipase
MRVETRLAVVGIMALLTTLAAGAHAWQAQEKSGQAAAKAKPPSRKPGGVRIPTGVPPKNATAKGDALSKAGDPGLEGVFEFRLGTRKDDYLAATYYRSTKGDSAPAIVLIHDKGRLSKDFEEPIRDLAGKSLAEALQTDGYAVLLLDLRGHGANPRPEKELGPKEWPSLIGDLQDAYTFLIDRHNRRELNLAKFAVLGLGTGANLVAHWAAQPEAATAPMARRGDLAAVVLVSPLADAEGLKLTADLPLFATPVPILIEAGEEDAASRDAAKAVEKIVERNRLSKIAYIPETSLKSERLLRFGPKATEPLLRFLDSSVKFRRDEWEPRYNLEPVPYRDVRPVARAKAATDKDKKTEPAPPEKKEKGDAEPKPQPDAVKKENAQAS